MAGYDQFILFGDSLFQHSSSQERGFSLAAALQAEYIRRLDVVNRGFSGYNTDQALKVLPKIIPSPAQVKIRFLVLFFGANDACMEGAQGSQHVPVDRYRQNLINIIKHPQVQAHNPRIILVTPPPVNEYATELNDAAKGIHERRRTANHTKLYADVVREVAESQKIALLDLWTVLMHHAGWTDGSKPLPGSKELAPNTFMRLLMHDGLHFTHVAYTLYFEEIMRVIEKTWPDQIPDRLSYVLPDWADSKAWSEGGEYQITPQ